MSQALDDVLAFDRVVVLDGSQHQEFTVAAFLALPLPLRVRYVLGGSLEFFRGSTPIDRVKALGQLRLHQAARRGSQAPS